MVDSEYSMDNYKSLKINIGAIIKKYEMKRLVPDWLKTKEMCKKAAKKLSFITRYAPDWYKAQEACDKPIIVEHSGTLIFVSGCYKNQTICNKAVYDYAHALIFPLLLED